MAVFCSAVPEVLGAPCSWFPFGVVVASCSPRRFPVLLRVAANSTPRTGEHNFGRARMCGGKQSRCDRKCVLRAVTLAQEVLVFRVVLFHSSARFRLPADPSMHGEISGLHRCTEVLTERGLSPQEILAAWRDFTMCAFLNPQRL